MNSSKLDSCSLMRQLHYDREMDDCTYAQYSYRSVRYDLWYKMRFFRDMLRSDIEGEKAALQRGPVGLLSMLPQEFTREDVRALRIAQGMKPDPKNVLKQWMCRGQVVKDDERGVYLKKR